MSLNRAQREELKALSLEVFGSSSRYQKLMNNGYSELVTEEIDEIVPGVDGAEDTVKKVKIPVKREDGALQYVTKYHTAESVKEYMLDLKKKQEEFKALMEKALAEQKARQEEQKAANAVQDQAGGSAL